jgi:hypothetical protein
LQNRKLLIRLVITALRVVCLARRSRLLEERRRFLLIGVVLLLPWYRARQEEERQRGEIVNALASTGLFDTAKTRAEFAAELKRVRAVNLPRARAFAEEAAQLAAMLNKPDFAALRRAPCEQSFKRRRKRSG